MTGRPARGEGPGRVLLAIDTATSLAVVALGSLDGALIAVESWRAGHRHSEELLPRIDALLDGTGTGRGLAALTGIAVGLGPGAFTGLRVGIATAKGLARATGLPLVGVSTADALLVAAAEAVGEEGRLDLDAPLALLVPAGAADRIVVAGGVATLLAGTAEPSVPASTPIVAVDLDGRAPGPALALGQRALDRLPTALVRLAAARLAAGDVDDPATLVPVYVTVPRGIAGVPGEDGPGVVTWLPGPR